MLRDLKLFRRNPGKKPDSEEVENVPIKPTELSGIQTVVDPTRPPLHTIQEPTQNPRPEQELGSRSKVDRTPPKGKAAWGQRTPEKQAVPRNKFGWGQKNEVDEGRSDASHLSRGTSIANGGLMTMTPRSVRTVGRAPSCQTECSSTQSTPTKSVTKPPYPGIGNGARPPVSLGARGGSFAALSKGVPVSCTPPLIVNTVEVPEFELKEDPAFWMDHNVQVLIRVRPLNSMEKSLHGYNRCFKQENAQSIAWVGQPETRFTFDHVACETINQEMLFRVAGLPMVENCMSGYNSCMFAYGQTGSGKTHTMLGEIDELEHKPSANRGMTPRIFEFLFARIRAEEESRRDENLKYNCKCSFLEIYNEQITDLLDPSSTNLLLREDIKNGVYVENLTELEVQTVNDILKLLTEGAANRRVAATNMNRESSRSHSVFTCVIESRWEKDSTTNLRFARLNLVDLAGSERQKTSGAEGERLKEAANINKSLSTLGHVIMLLVDVAHGKQRHIPYRDSRLTFLLQESLGGNSKTMIIANVSPSICCAAETLSTLKFAQRAKLIQNNAVVNEDASGDVITLQHQIRVLKEEISVLKRRNISRSLSFCSRSLGDIDGEGHAEAAEVVSELAHDHEDISHGSASGGVMRMSSKQLKSLEATLVGALRREQMADNSIKQLEAEIGQLNRLVLQREEDTRCIKMMLKFREEKIQRTESLEGGYMPSDAYLLEENKALSEELQLIRARADRNPEVTRFALENIRLLEKLREFQDFYEEGEREMLLTEVSELRNQLLRFLDGKTEHPGPNNNVTIQLNQTHTELENCRNNLSSCLEVNAKLTREINDLRAQLDNHKSSCYDQDTEVKSTKMASMDVEGFESRLLEAIEKEKVNWKHETTMKYIDEIMNLQLEVDITKIILQEERSSSSCLSSELQMVNERCLHIRTQCRDAENKLKDASSVIEALESQQILLINELDSLRDSNIKYLELLSKQDQEICDLRDQICSQELTKSPSLEHLDSEDTPLQAKLKRMQISLEKARKLNMWYKSDQAFQTTHEEEMDEVRREVEAETAEVIVCLQEELSSLQQQVKDCNVKEMETQENMLLLETKSKDLQERLHLTIQDKEKLSALLEEKDEELRMLSEQWEKLAFEIEEIIADGHEALRDVSDQVDSITSSLPQRTWISEQVGRILRNISEKDIMIQELQRCLEEAQGIRIDLESKLNSLRGAVLAITEAQEQESTEKQKEILLLAEQVGEKTSSITELEKRIKMKEYQMKKAGTCATVAFLVVNRLSEINSDCLGVLKHKDIQLNQTIDLNSKKDAHLQDQAAVIEEAENQIQALRKELGDSGKSCLELKAKLSEEEARALFMEEKLAAVEKDVLLKAREKLDEFKSGVSTLSSCINEYADQARGVEIVQNGHLSADNYFNEPSLTESNENINKKDLHVTGDMGNHILKSSFKTSENVNSCEQEDLCDRDQTILLLRKEIESALESLRRVQAQMVQLRQEKEEIRNSEKQSRKDLECLVSQILTLEGEINTSEKQADTRLTELDSKLQKLEEMAHDASIFRSQKQDVLELEVHDAKMVAVQKNAEAACLLAKYEEAQETIKEADVMVNALMAANERGKLEIERVKKMEAAAIDERDYFFSEIQRLQASIDQKDQQYDNLEEQYCSDLLDTRSVVLSLEDIVTQAQTTFKEEHESLLHDIHCLKTQLLDSASLTRSWLEDVWSKIIVKDCAMSVLHVCHMGVLLEAVNGLNAENGLLHHGLCESNYAIENLKQHNFKAKRELEMCSVLKGKLLVDIKNSFDRISRKEDESGKLSARLMSFEKKIVDLQLQEELMLARSNSIGSELSLLVKELNVSNSNASLALLDQQKQLEDKEQIMDAEVEFITLDLTAKDYESFILASELQNTANEKAELKRQKDKVSADLDDMKNNFILLMVEAELEKQCFMDLEVEVGLLKVLIVESDEERNALLEQLKQCSSRLSEVEETKVALEREFQSLEEISLLNDQLKDELGVVMETKERLMTEVQELKAENGNLVKELKMNETALEASVCKLRSELSWKDTELQRTNSLLRSNLKRFVHSLEAVNMTEKRIFRFLDEKNVFLLDNMFYDICENKEKASELIMECKYLENSTEELISENLSYQAELSRKDEILKGLLFDLSLLQESASNAKDQKDEVEEMVAAMDSLEDDLNEKSAELDEAVTRAQMLEAQLAEKSDLIYALELNVSKERESLKLVMDENAELRYQIDISFQAKSSLEEELIEKSKMMEGLEMEILQMDNALSQTNNFLEDLKNRLSEVSSERDRLDTDVLVLQEKLEMAQALADETEAIAVEAQQIAELRKTYAEEKEEEVKLLERSVEELEHTVNALENKVDVIKGEAEKQRLQREELEIELQAIRHKKLGATTSTTRDIGKENIRNGTGTHLQRQLQEIERERQEAYKQIQVLEKNITEKDAEISQCRVYISELNLHAEAQARDYKQKFKALEAMAEQVKPDPPSSHLTTLSSTKTEKNAAKPRGSGSPFKCIGLGLVQQISSEKDEELTAGRQRIEELEALAASRQKEIFMLNTRLAAAESMTHDVIRDLLGVKLDMTNYASLLDHQQVQKVTEKAQLQREESLVKDKEVVKLRQQLNEFIEERQGWLEEINRRHAEMVAAQIASEKLRQRDQFLTTENEMLKKENVSHKKKVMELEDEVKKLSGQQNLQQRIHHHAKIKEENNLLKTQNEDLSAKLRRTENILTRMKEDLARYRSSNGRNPFIDFDQEHRLNNKLKETDEERLQLAQKLLGLCTSVLKAAGITRPLSDINVSDAEEALSELRSRIVSLEREVQDLTFKNKVSNERARLSELKQHPSPLSSRGEENNTTPGRKPQTPFLTALSR